MQNLDLLQVGIASFNEKANSVVVIFKVLIFINIKLYTRHLNADNVKLIP